MGPAGHGDVDFREGDPAGKPIALFNNGNMRRDFTYVDDVVEAVVRLVDRVPAAPIRQWSGDAPDPATSTAPWRIYNIGNNSPVEVLHVVDLAGKGPRQEGEARNSADAAGRRAGNLCRC